MSSRDVLNPLRAPCASERAYDALRTVHAPLNRVLCPLQTRTLTRILHGCYNSPRSSWAHTSPRAAACPLEVRSSARCMHPCASEHPRSSIAGCTQALTRAPHRWLCPPCSPCSSTKHLRR